ncbi:MAG TPA: type II toxin-antitoxin system PemK/MazF family toxin [Acidimicrobiales bacterium]|nr:type II toxin-antitoxin system PemK/MazF family toxin [Acidimicrobiales bacterium]
MKLPTPRAWPYLLVTRNEAMPVLRTVLVAPVTRTIRGIVTEVELGPDEGLSVACAASLDNLLTFPKPMLVRRVGALSAPRRLELCQALMAVADC